MVARRQRAQSSPAAGRHQLGQGGLTLESPIADRDLMPTTDTLNDG